MSRCKNRGVKLGGYNVDAVRVRGPSSNKMVDAIAEIYAGQGFEGCLKSWVLTSRRLKWYFCFMQTQMNLENQIQQSLWNGRPQLTKLPIRD